MTWLILLGAIASAGIGAIFESNRWLLTIITPILVAFLFFQAGVRLQYRLLRKFYIKIPSIHYQLLSIETKRKVIIIELTISNQYGKPSGISDWGLEIKSNDADKKWLKPISLGNEANMGYIQGKKNLMGSHYLQTNEPLTGYLCFEYTDIEYQNAKLFVFDDTGAYRSVPINEDTMVKMAKKSTSRSEDYHIE